MGRGAWVTRCDVFCHSYPESLNPLYVDACGDYYFRPETRPEVETFNCTFWSIDEALAYTNGEDGGALARETVAVDVDRLATAAK